MNQAMQFSHDQLHEDVYLVSSAWIISYQISEFKDHDIYNLWVMFYVIPPFLLPSLPQDPLAAPPMIPNHTP